MSAKNSINEAYLLAQDRYAALGIDTNFVLQRLAAVPISLHVVFISKPPLEKMGERKRV